MNKKRLGSILSDRNGLTHDYVFSTDINNLPYAATKDRDKRIPSQPLPPSSYSLIIEIETKKSFGTKIFWYTTIKILVDICLCRFCSCVRINSN